MAKSQTRLDNNKHVWNAPHQVPPRASGGSVEKKPSANAGDVGDTGSLPRLGRLPGKGNGSPLQYSRHGKAYGQRSLAATIHGVTRIGHDWATNQQQVPPHQPLGILPIDLEVSRQKCSRPRSGPVGSGLWSGPQGTRAPSSQAPRKPPIQQQDTGPA